ncbi:hypothetical protein ACIQVT_00725 [Streptomyces sp. NPDC100445]|uniref:hypothetical protein n=1 Tax=Streptomyces sp. NPDC100445 TaxID=3366102 RepID=UPI00381C0828
MWRHDLLDSAAQASDQPRLRESTLPLFRHFTGLVARCRSERDATRNADGPNEAVPPPAVTAAALWSNLHGMAQLWAWSSLQLALGAPPLDGDNQRDRLITAVLDAHLGPATS